MTFCGVTFWLKHGWKWEQRSAGMLYAPCRPTSSPGLEQSEWLSKLPKGERVKSMMRISPVDVAYASIIHCTYDTAAWRCHARWRVTLRPSANAERYVRTNLTLNIRLMRQLLCGSGQSDAKRWRRRSTQKQRSRSKRSATTSHNSLCSQRSCHRQTHCFVHGRVK